MFQSDHDFDVFSSPMTNPFYFVDPRALTEVRPVFIWQHTSNNNPVWNGGNNFDYTLVGSVAITENISLVVNRLGFTTIAPRGGTTGISSNTGFSETMLGPKLTFLRSETSGTVAAVGLTFDIPDGSSAVLQDTGHLMLAPYFCIAQNFGRSEYGSFNFMNTTGYNFRTDNTRSESIYSSFHLDYEIAKRVWPFIEFNWWHYTRNGGATPPQFRKRRPGQLRLGSRLRPRRINRGDRHPRQAQQLHLLGHRCRIQRAEQQQWPAPGRLPADDRFDLPLLEVGSRQQTVRRGTRSQTPFGNAVQKLRFESCLLPANCYLLLAARLDRFAFPMAHHERIAGQFAAQVIRLRPARMPSTAA